MPSTTTVTQLSLPGQTAAPEGPVDMIGMFLMHFAFRRDLARFVPAVAGTPVGERATWVALRDRWARFAHVLHGHHSLEDAELWPRLQAAVTAAADAEAQEVLDAMAAEHAEIDPLLTGVADGLDRMIAAPSLDARAALAVRMVAARDSLGRHMAHEEQSALPLVQRHLTPQDWAAMEAASPKGKPGELAFIVPWVLHEMPTHAMPRVRAFGGPVLIGLGRLFRRSFERKERRAFGQ
jgi:iron-sulfur cluster repair protein YtfE (RIC family)